MAENWKLNPIESAQRGENPTFIGSMRSGIVLFGYTQFLPGYCLLIATPKISSLNELDGDPNISLLSYGHFDEKQVL